MNAVRLCDESVEAVAQRLAEILRDEALSPAALVDAAEIARRYSMSVHTVREHADELGAVRIGTGPKAHLRFDPAIVAERLAPTPPPASSTPPPRRHRRGEATDLELLPIRGTA